MDLLRGVAVMRVLVGAGPPPMPPASREVEPKPAVPKPKNAGAVRGRKQGTSPASTPFARRGMIRAARSEEHTSELQSLMRISYAVFCLKKKTKKLAHTGHKQQKRQ